MTNLELLDCIPRGGTRPSSLRSIYSCTEDAHLHGFKPLAAYGTAVDLSEFNANLKQPALAKKHWPLKFGIHYLLLLKENQLYVDKIDGRDRSRLYYGINEQMPCLENIILPPDVYDFFKARAEEYWPATISSYSPS